MTSIIHMEPLTAAKYPAYIEIGISAYNAHYQHLWKAKDSSSYLESSFTLEVLLKEERDSNTALFLINKNKEAVGILKFTIDCPLENHSEKNALYIDKIYIKKEHTGIGVGKKVLQFVLLRAKELGKKMVWLDTMQNGPALAFYLKNGFAIHSSKMLHFSDVLEKEKPMYVLTRTI